MEFAEIDLLIRTEVETVKAFITRQSDRYREPLAPAPSTLPGKESWPALRTRTIRSVTPPETAAFGPSFARSPAPIWWPNNVSNCGPKLPLVRQPANRTGSTIQTFKPPLPKNKTTAKRRMYGPIAFAISSPNEP